MRRVHELIAARENHILDEAAQLEVQDRALGVPQNQPWPDVFLNRKQIELLTDDTVVALTRFLEPADVALEIILLRDLGHFLFDGLEVFRRKRPPDVEVVVEPILDRRTEPDLRLGKELAHRSRQDVRR